MERGLQDVAPWALRAAWAAAPFAVGPVLGRALDGDTRAVAVTGAVALWAAWGVVLLATLVPHPVSLTVLRSGVPAALGAAVVAVVAGHVSVLALVWGAVTTAIAFLPEVGRHHVNGPAYPNERRYPLRTPGSVLLGSLPVAWALAVGVPAAGLLLVAAGQTLGIPLLAFGIAIAILVGRALHRLSRRWLVFVPAGLVMHDHLALADPVLFPRKRIRSVAAAPAGTPATDLTLAAPGLALEIALHEPAELGRPVQGRTLGKEIVATAVLVTPTRPGAVLREAAARRVPVGDQSAMPPPSTSSPR